jgi:hypothetical protein
MKPRGNSHDNDAPHHLYEIFDVERDDTYKYGISGKPLCADGSSPRANEQVKMFNKVAGMARFFGSVLESDIPGHKQAERLEADYVSAYSAQHGHRPLGNL